MNAAATVLAAGGIHVGDWRWTERELKMLGLSVEEEPGQQ